MDDFLLNTYRGKFLLKIFQRKILLNVILRLRIRLIIILKSISNLFNT